MNKKKRLIWVLSILICFWILLRALDCCGSYFTMSDSGVNSEFNHDVKDDNQDEEDEDEIQMMSNNSSTERPVDPLALFQIPEDQGYVLMVNPQSGLGDRLRGIVGGFFLAKFLKRKLLISERYFVNTSFMMPTAEIAWDSPDADAVYAENKDRCFQITMQKSPKREKKPMDDIHRINFHHVEANFSTIVLTSNMDLLPEMKRNPTLRGRPGFDEMLQLRKKGLSWQFVLQHLFKPGPVVENLLKKVEDEFFAPNSELTYKVGIHIRTGDKEIANKGKSNQFSTWIPQCFAGQALKLWKAIPEEERIAKFPGGLKVLIATDSKAATKAVLNYFDGLKDKAISDHNQQITIFETFNIAGEAVHLDHPSRTMRKNQSRTFLDWWLFTKMDSLIISQSGYSGSAARYNCQPTYVQKVKEDQIKTCDDFFMGFNASGLCIFPTSHSVRLFFRSHLA